MDSIAITPKMHRSELMEYVHMPELISATYSIEVDCDINACPRLRLLYKSTSSYDLTSDPYYMELENIANDDAYASRKLRKLLMSRKTYCSEQLKSLLRRAQDLISDIGPSAVEHYIDMCITKFLLNLKHVSQNWMPEMSDLEKTHLGSIFSTIKTNAEQDTSASLQPVFTLLSPKADTLLDMLARHYSDDLIGIIFVEKRTTVALLAELISSHSKTAHLYKVGTFVGTSNSLLRKGNVADIVEPKGQQQTLDDFRSGEKNLIIATSVLEEGIDVSSCQVVICFDLPKNLVSFVQRRGRARKQKSKYIMLVPEDNETAYMDDARKSLEAIELEKVVQDGDRHYRVESTG